MAQGPITPGPGRDERNSAHAGVPAFAGTTRGDITQNLNKSLAERSVRIGLSVALNQFQGDPHQPMSDLIVRAVPRQIAQEGLILRCVGAGVELFSTGILI
jgi:hypothetical protein